MSKFIREKGYEQILLSCGLGGSGGSRHIDLDLALPQFIKPLFAGLSIFQAKTGGAATVGEAAPLFSMVGQSPWQMFPGLSSSASSCSISFTLPDCLAILFTTFTFALMALILLLIRNVKSQMPADILIITWSMIILVMAMAQNRFAYYYGSMWPFSQDFW